MTLAERLSPNRIRCSGRFTAMLAFILGERWTDPAITEMVNAGGMLLLATEDDPFCNEFVGDIEDLWRNLYGVAEAAGLDDDETRQLIQVAHARVRHV